MKNKVLVRILSVFGAIVLAIGVGFGAYSFKSNNPNFKAKNYIASADEVVTENVFYGSDLLYNISISVSDVAGGRTGMNLNVGYAIPKFTLSSSSFTIDYFSSILFSYGDGSMLNFYNHNTYSFDFVFDTSTELSLFTVGSSSALEDWYLHLYYNVQSGFNADVYKVRIFSDSASTPYIWTHVVYYDKEDRTCDFAFLSYFEAPNDILLNDRTYYFGSVLDDNQLFNSGVQEGIVRGRIEGEVIGYEKGKNDGIAFGRVLGYNEGIADGSDISFLGMFSAIFDSPIQAITGMFNFDFLGVNILSLITSLFTLSVLFFIVRLILFK